MKSFNEFIVHDKCGTPECCMKCDTAVSVDEGSASHTGKRTGETWEDGYDRRVVQVTDPDQKRMDTLGASKAKNEMKSRLNCTKVSLILKNLKNKCAV